MRTATMSILICLAWAGPGCSDGSEVLQGRLGGFTGTAGAGATGGGGSAGAGGGSAAGVGGASLEAGPDGLRSGPFRMLVFSAVLEYPHVSIATGQQMLRDLGATADADLPQGAKPGSQFEVVIAKDDLSDFTEANLRNYEILFWMNPTGPVFSTAGANGIAGKAAVQNFMDSGGAWAGVHSATDFEKTAQWTWFQDLVGGYFVSHNDPGTPGAVVMQPAAVAADHPAIRGLSGTWNCDEEWYFMNRNPETLPGYTILAKLGADQRPVSWVHDLAGGGRTFYTIRGHDPSAYAEPDFRRHVHQGILWAVHRMR